MERFLRFHSSNSQIPTNFLSRIFCELQRTEEQMRKGVVYVAKVVW